MAEKKTEQKSLPDRRNCHLAGKIEAGTQERAVENLESTHNNLGVIRKKKKDKIKIVCIIAKRKGHSEMTGKGN